MKCRNRVLLILFLLACCAQAAGAAIAAHGVPTEIGGTAVSLRELQRTLAARPAGAPIPREIAELGGMTRPLGYVIDAATKDIILFGGDDSSAPLMYLDDFVVALRNAYLKYAELRGNTYLYSNPGCTIDPDPNVIKDLQRLAGEIDAAPNLRETEAVIRQWHRRCRAPQTVKVLGIPPGSRFGKVMVTADYDMKRLVDGSDSLRAVGFRSLTDITLERMKAAIMKESALSLSPSSLNRFWFCPGDVSYQVASRAVVVDRCPVVLLTEEEHLAASGSIQGSGRSDPFAREFTEAFSRVYDKVAVERPIYRELENLFRLVAIAKMMEYSHAPDSAGLDIGYLLDKHRIGTVAVNRTLPGRSHVKEFKHRKKAKNGYTDYFVWLPSCGGVSMDIDPKRAEKTTRNKEALSALVRSILSQRPGEPSVTWKVQLPLKGELEGPKDVKVDRAYALFIH